MKMKKPTLMLVAVAALAGGCASYPAPTEHFATSTASTRAAQEIGAQANPQASLAARLAQDENNQARQLMSDGDNERADYMTMRANADAQLAIAIVREQQARAQANQALARLQEVGAKTMTTSGTQPSGAPAPAGSTKAPSPTPVAPATPPANTP
jgi:hypothetical protein